MGGKAALLIVLGFSTIMVIVGLNMNRASTSAVDNSTNYYKFIKVDTSGNITFHDCAISGLNTDINFSYKFLMYYNGANIIVLTPSAIYAVSMDLSNQVLKSTYSGAQAVAFPWNMHEVTGRYMFGGSTTEGQFPYYISEEKFYL